MNIEIKPIAEPKHRAYDVFNAKIGIPLGTIFWSGGEYRFHAIDEMSFSRWDLDSIVTMIDRLEKNVTK